MSEATTPESAGWRMKVAAFALSAAIFSVLWFMVAALGTKWGFWPWQVGLGQMTLQTGPVVTFLALGLSIIAQIIALIKAPRVRPFIIALAGTLISAMLLFRLMGIGAQANSLPPIHDVQTDWGDPVQFSETLLATRKADGETNEVGDALTIPEEVEERWPEMGGKLVSVAQTDAEEGWTRSDGAVFEPVYPPLDPLYFDQSPEELASIVQRIVERQGWDIVTSAEAAGAGDSIQIEATATSGWFGFKDDVAIRLRPVEGATRVDMRSVSRVGLSDLGANSKRVYGFMMELQDRGDGRLEP